MRTPAGDDVVIVSAVRTALGRFQGTLRDVPAPELGAVVVREALCRAKLGPAQVDEVLLGQALQAGVGQGPARQAALAAGLPPTVAATTINKVCGSGLKAVSLGAALLRAGEAQVIVAGGMEAMNRAPYLLPQARFGYRLGEGTLVDAAVHDGLWCALTDQHMGLAAEWIADAYGVSRADMDAWALQSHQRALRALDEGAFAAEVVGVSVAVGKGQRALFAVDECPRRDTNAGKLAALPAVFCEGGRVTAGNASGLADGAAAVVLMRRDTAQECGCRPLARVVGCAEAGVPPQEIFTAPILAVRKVLCRSGMALADVELFELNEAFAAQVVTDVRALELDPARVNVNGGGIALGHPLGASGARILVTLLHALAARSLGVGLAAICLGGGEAVAMVVERE